MRARTRNSTRMRAPTANGAVPRVSEYCCRIFCGNTFMVLSYGWNFSITEVSLRLALASVSSRHSSLPPALGPDGRGMAYIRWVQGGGGHRNCVRWQFGFPGSGVCSHFLWPPENRLWFSGRKGNLLCSSIFSILLNLPFRAVWESPRT